LPRELKNILSAGRPFRETGKGRKQERGQVRKGQVWWIKFEEFLLKRNSVVLWQKPSLDARPGCERSCARYEQRKIVQQCGLGLAFLRRAGYENTGSYLGD
jgi:hypothetical protein